MKQKAEVGFEKLGIHGYLPDGRVIYSVVRAGVIDFYAPRDPIITPKPLHLSDGQNTPNMARHLFLSSLSHDVTSSPSSMTMMLPSSLP